MPRVAGSAEFTTAYRGALASLALTSEVTAPAGMPATGAKLVPPLVLTKSPPPPVLGEIGSASAATIRLPRATTPTTLLSRVPPPSVVQFAPPSAL